MKERASCQLFKRKRERNGEETGERAVELAAGKGTFCDSEEKPRTKAVKGGRGPWAP